MNSSVLKDALKEGIAVGERIAPRSPSLPILSTILLTAEKNTIQMSATDLEIGVRYLVLAKNEKEGSVAVPPKILAQFLSAVPGPQVRLVAREHGLGVESGGFRATLKALAADDFPIIPSLKDGKGSVALEANNLCSGLAAVMNFTGQTQARPEISGIYFLFQKNVLRLVSTDSFRLAEKTLRLRQEIPQEYSFILPAKAARELVSVLSERTGTATLHWSPTQVIFDYKKEGEPAEPKIQLVSRVIEGEYPKYQDVIPQQPATRTLLRKEELLVHLKAASAFSGRMNDVRFAVRPEKKTIEILSRNADVGENTSELAASITGPKTEASFNWRFLSEGLLQIKSSEVEIGLTGEEGPALVKPAQDEGYLYVLMPIKA